MNDSNSGLNLTKPCLKYIYPINFITNFIFLSTIGLTNWQLTHNNRLQGFQKLVQPGLILRLIR